MLVKEYRIPLPMAVEEYRVAQLYMIQVGGGAGAGRTRTALSTCACDAMRPSQRSVCRWVSGWRAASAALRTAPRRGRLWRCMSSPARNSGLVMLIISLSQMGPSCPVDSGCHNQTAQTGGLEQTFTPHRSGGWEAGDQGAARFRAW